MAARKAEDTSRRSQSAVSNTKRPRRTRRRYTDAERQQVLEAARREGLSGPKAAKRFGISTLTFYNWRKKAGLGKSRRSKGPRAPLSSADGVANLIREQVRGQIQQLLPEIIREEVDTALAGHRGTRR